jgi:hypothetical protein
MTIKLIKLALSASILSLASATAHAQPGEQKLGQELGSAGAKWGVAVVRAVIKSDPGARFIPPPEVGQADGALRAVIDEHNRRKARVESSLTILEGAANGTADLAAAVTVAGSGGAAAVPVLMVRTAVQAATDDYFRTARTEADESMRAFLARNQSRIEKDAGVDYEELQGMSADQIRARLESGTRAFRALEKSVDDPALKDFSRELLVSTIVNTNRATLDEVARQGTKIVDLDKRVEALGKAHRALADFTVTSLDRQQQSIDALGQGVQRLDKAVAAVDARLASQERNMDFVQGFMFNKMSADEKVAALKSGYMNHRFNCPSGQSSCDQKVLKDSLIERYEAEAFIQKTVQTAGRVVQDANGLLQIATNLGIKVGPAAQAVQYGTVAFNAFAAAATGNYIGAIASLTGAFASKGPDPQMKFMMAQFKQINQKLDKVLENQKKLSEQITQLSLRLDEHMEGLNKRFDRVDFHLAQVRQLTAMQLNAPWQPCQELFRRATLPGGAGDAGFDIPSSMFASIEKASTFAMSNSEMLKGCTTVITLRPGSFSNPGWFGNFLNVSSQVTQNDSKLLEVFANRDDTWAVVTDFLDRRNIPYWQALRLYAAPAATLDHARARYASAVTGDPCNLNGGPLAGDRLGPMLCERTPGNVSNAAATATAILGTPMVAEHAIDVSGWIMLEQALVDVHAVRASGTPVSALELIRSAPGEALSKGEQHVERALVTLDAATANESMLSGDLTVDAVVEILQSTALADAAAEARRQKMLGRVRRMLLAQPALRQNVGMAFLRSRLGIYVAGAKTPTVPRPDAYSTAVRMAEDATGGNQFALYETLFGPGLEYRRDPSKKTYLILMPGSSSTDQVVVPMPEPTVLAEGRLLYPNMIDRLRAARQHAGVRYLDYGATRNLSADQRVALSASMARAEAVQ